MTAVEGKMEKAVRLYEAGHVVFLPAKYAARVVGDHGTYVVVAFDDGLACNCPAGSRGTCSHAFAAMLAWNELKRGEHREDAD